MLMIKVLLSLFLSGAIAVFTLYRIFGAPVKPTLKKGILSVVLSVCFNGIAVNIHHGYMGLSEHILFDCVSLVVIALLSACLAATVLSFLPTKMVRRILFGKRAYQTHIRVLKPQAEKCRAA